MDFATLTAATVSELSNKELIEACKHFNISCGAVNRTSRNLFEKKLVAALSSNTDHPSHTVEEVEEIFEENPTTPLFANESGTIRNSFISESANVYNDTPYPTVRTSRVTKRITTNISPKSCLNEGYKYGEEENYDGEESVRILTKAERDERRARLLSGNMHREYPVVREEKKPFWYTLLKIVCFALFVLFAYFFYKEHMQRLQDESNDDL